MESPFAEFHFPGDKDLALIKDEESIPSTIVVDSLAPEVSLVPPPVQELPSILVFPAAVAQAPQDVAPVASAPLTPQNVASAPLQAPVAQAPLTPLTPPLLQIATPVAQAATSHSVFLKEDNNYTFFDRFLPKRFFKCL